jgi:frataxin-like iron-binding protein CyaY
MASTYSTSLKLTLIGDGDQTGTWGQTTNANFGTLLEQAIVGQTSITMANADYTLTNLNGALDEARSAVIIITGTQNATFSVIFPAVPKLYIITNSLTASQIAYIKPSGGNTFQVPYGRTMYLYTNGTTFYALDYVTNAQNLVTGGTITTGAINCTSLTSSGGIIGTTGAFSGAITGTTIGGTTITAGTQFTGLGTGLSGTAASLNIGGTALNITASSNTTLTSLTNLVTVGTITSGTWSGSFGAVSGANLTNITGANVTGTVANATTAVNSTNATTATTAVTVSTTVASGAVGTTQATATSNTQIATTAFVQAVKQTLYPIGSIYSSTSATNPCDASMLGFGTWIQFAAGKFLMGNGNGSYPAGTSSGSADAVLVSHDHTGSTGLGNQGHVHAYSGTTGGQSVSHNHSALEPSGGTYQNVGGNFGGDYNLASYGSTPNGTYVTGGASVDHNHAYSGTTGDQSTGHIHGITAQGVSATNANLPPYIVVYMWNRTS